jgi:uncharacterized protein YukE
VGHQRTRQIHAEGPQPAWGSIPILPGVDVDQYDPMSSQLHGADLEAMAQLSRSFDRNANRLRAITGAASAGVAGLPGLWAGSDSVQFRQRWMQVHRPHLLRAIDALLDAGATVERNRQAQEITSTADSGVSGGTGGGTGPVGPGGPGDQGGDGGKKIDDDVRVVDWDPVTDPLFRSPGGENSVHPNDVDQQSLRDCYFVAALAGLANDDPNTIRNNISDNGDGTYTVTLHEWVDGELQPVEVTVDNKMPVTEVWNEDAGAWEAKDGFTAGEADGELWPRIYEKAYAHLLGDGDLVAGYAEIMGGDGADALEALTGQPSTTVSTGDLTFEELSTMLDEGSVLPASQREVPGSGWWIFGGETDGNYTIGDDKIHTRHQYWVESVNDTVDPPTVIVRNPWDYDTYNIEMTMEEFNDAFREVDHNPHG